MLSGRKIFTHQGQDRRSGAKHGVFCAKHTRSPSPTHSYPLQSGLGVPSQPETRLSPGSVFSSIKWEAHPFAGRAGPSQSLSLSPPPPNVESAPVSAKGEGPSSDSGPFPLALHRVCSLISFTSLLHQHCLIEAFLIHPI